MAQKVKNPPAVLETRVRSLGLEDPLEEGMATHSSILAWKIPWSEEPGGLRSMGSHRVDFLQETGPSYTLGHTSLGWAPVAGGREEGWGGGGALTERRTHRGMTKQGWTALPNSPGKERQEGESWQNS